MKIVRMMGAGMTYFCIGTVIAQLVLVTILWFKGNLSSDRIYRLMAAFHNVDMGAIKEKLKEEQKPKESEQESFEARQSSQMSKAMNLSLRASAVDKGLGDLYGLTIQLNQVKTRYETLLKSFETRLTNLEQESNTAAIGEVQRILEAMAPKQAKTQILKMIDDGAMNHVVHIMQSMAIEKRKKIIAEFKEDDEPEKLREILRLIRLGIDKAILIDDTRKELRKLRS